MKKVILSILILLIGFKVHAQCNFTDTSVPIIDSIRVETATCPDNGKIYVYPNPNSGGGTFQYTIISGPITRGIQSNNDFEALKGNNNAVYKVRVHGCNGTEIDTLVRVPLNYTYLNSAFFTSSYKVITNCGSASPTQFKLSLTISYDSTTNPFIRYPLSYQISDNSTSFTGPINNFTPSEPDSIYSIEKRVFKIDELIGTFDAGTTQYIRVYDACNNFITLAGLALPNASSSTSYVFNLKLYDELNAPTNYLNWGVAAYNPNNICGIGYSFWVKDPTTYINSYGSSASPNTTLIDPDDTYSPIIYNESPWEVTITNTATSAVLATFKANASYRASNDTMFSISYPYDYGKITHNVLATPNTYLPRLPQSTPITMTVRDACGTILQTSNYTTPSPIPFAIDYQLYCSDRSDSAWVGYGIAANNWGYHKKEFSVYRMPDHTLLKHDTIPAGSVTAIDFYNYNNDRGKTIYFSILDKVGNTLRIIGEDGCGRIDSLDVVVNTTSPGLYSFHPEINILTVSLSSNAVQQCGTTGCGQKFQLNFTNTGTNTTANRVWLVEGPSLPNGVTYPIRSNSVPFASNCLSWNFGGVTADYSFINCNNRSGPLMTDDDYSKMNWSTEFCPGTYKAVVYFNDSCYGWDIDTLTFTLPSSSTPATFTYNNVYSVNSAACPTPGRYAYRVSSTINGSLPLGDITTCITDAPADFTPILQNYIDELVNTTASLGGLPYKSSDICDTVIAFTYVPNIIPGNLPYCTSTTAQISGNPLFYLGEIQREIRNSCTNTTVYDTIKLNKTIISVVLLNNLNLPNGSYTITRTDACGNTLESDNFVLTGTPNSPLAATATYAQCSGGSKVVTVNGTGGVAPYQYQIKCYNEDNTMWTALQTSNSFTIPASNSCTLFDVRVVDGCGTSASSQADFSLLQHEYSPIKINTLGCNGTDAEFELITSDFTPYSVYAWKSGSPTGSNIGSTPTLPKNIVSLTPGTTETLCLTVDENIGCLLDTTCTTITVLLDCTLLPVELLSFIGRSEGCRVHLKWSTGLEINTKHFEVERLIGDGTYVKINTILSKGSNSIYEMVDIIADKNVQYRLKIIDNDGTFKYSNILFFTETCKKDGLPKFSLYPNPTLVNNKNFVIEYNNEDKNLQHLDITILTLEGKEMYSEIRQINNGMNALMIKGLDLPQGVYIVKLQNNKNKSELIGSLKLIVQ